MRISWISVGVLVGLAVTGFGCGKGPAEQALRSADEAIAAVQPDVEKYVPEQFRLLVDEVNAAHADYDKGNYRAALAAAKEIPGRIEEVKAAAAKRKDELTVIWKQMEEGIPATMATLRAKVDEISKTKKMPKGMNSEAFESAKTEVAGLDQRWAEAMQAFQAGQVIEATEAGAQIGTRADELTTAFGIEPAKPAAAPAGADAQAAPQGSGG